MCFLQNVSNPRWHMNSFIITAAALRKYDTDLLDPSHACIFSQKFRYLRLYMHESEIRNFHKKLETLYLQIDFIFIVLSDLFFIVVKGI